MTSYIVQFVLSEQFNDLITLFDLANAQVSLWSHDIMDDV